MSIVLQIDSSYCFSVAKVFLWAILMRMATRQEGSLNALKEHLLFMFIFPFIQNAFATLLLFTVFEISEMVAFISKLNEQTNSLYLAIFKR